MIRTLRAPALLAAGVVFLLPLAANATEEIYGTSFEDSGSGGAEDYPAGDYAAPATIGSWSLTSGAATIGAMDTPDGSDQGVTLTGGAQFDRAITGAISDGIFVEGWFRGEGSTLDLSRAVYPVDESASAVVHFSFDEGIQLLNGDGLGGPGTIVSTGVELGRDNATLWRRVSLYLNFPESKWDCHIGELGQSGFESFRDLGFRDGVTSLNGFRNLAEADSDFDAFRIVRPMTGDANGDSLLDAADAVRVAEYALRGANDPILAFNADMDHNNLINDEDLGILVDVVTGKGG